MLSIIIPTLNNADSLPGTLSMLKTGQYQAEIVIYDGGSVDETKTIANSHKAILIDSKRGRGQQMAAGASASSGDWLLFLHADTQLSSGWQTTVQDFIEDPANILRVAFFVFALDDQSVQARRLEKLVGWRCRIFKLPYGDQGLLIKRSFYNLLGGYSPIPLMEDVEFIRKVGSHSIEPLPITATTSAYRYQKDGYIFRSTKNVMCLILYFFGVHPSKIERFYVT